jgi:hypothetical protein
LLKSTLVRAVLTASREDLEAVPFIGTRHTADSHLALAWFRYKRRESYCMLRCPCAEEQLIDSIERAASLAADSAAKEESSAGVTTDGWGDINDLDWNDGKDEDDADAAGTDGASAEAAARLQVEDAVDDFFLALRELVELSCARQEFSSSLSDRNDRGGQASKELWPVSGVARLVKAMLEPRKQAVPGLEHLGSALQQIGREALKATAGLFG